ncbi:LamG domain-containing protein [Actinoplanes sp. NEAU-A12]|uniref:LamG domain-containing protein n=1 Tax=Actinoplanes sandaracinus TaxID=3045177 RepID=A0ABT6WPV9_9ACTN|nr:LamG-like jellyroll fold domain-containing protein [Actinoplanes sandaracinus]MDI6101775.1 LamG domain-containing protein [Actinoplanes sandaracinus]
MLSCRRAATIALLAVLPAAAFAVAVTFHRPVRSTPAVWVTPSVPPVVTVARYGFEDPRQWADASEFRHDLTPYAGNDARVRRVPHGAGQAIQFPPPCAREPCPHLILRVLSRPALNPGASPFSYGATVRLARRHTTDGQNVLQKGYAAEGSQYKLQVDGQAGLPSCVLVGEESRRIHVAVADVGVADGGWHQVTCRRGPDTLTILVDGAPRASTPIPPALRVDNAMSLNIGGKSAHARNDQFHGAVDDIWISRP